MNVQKLIEQCQTTSESENLKIERLRAQTEENRRRTEESRQATRRFEIQAVDGERHLCTLAVPHYDIQPMIPDLGRSMICK